MSVTDGGSVHGGGAHGSDGHRGGGHGGSGHANSGHGGGADEGGGHMSVAHGGSGQGRVADEGGADGGGAYEGDAHGRVADEGRGHGGGTHDEGAQTPWLLPIDPAAHAEHLPPDWRTRPDATAVWEAIGRSQPPDRWCLRSGYRTMRTGDAIWAYLSRRQEVCAVGRVRAVVEEDGRWYVVIDWDAAATDALCRTPLPRARFGQVPMSTCRARPAAAAVLAQVRHRLPSTD